ncbi:MAG: restriction endonuclease [Magnetococcales bacterium]|uniref:Restriction endonuclease n=1 Tax=Candidatus Magnetobacterium casense TaxID=1455061 RepID=A0ABS6RTM7_9BACT|nr:BsuBI/PstI family type II restriction endonuclease [Candidatus Magnetobacterium casensis]MBF0607882.1 restriction endonuclease [Nitrospirota bacterium]MBV6339973.1 restriction endonuclease [Candidatus Magnetobacterium casensis]
MSKIEDAQDILKAFGLPLSQQNDISALTLLALCGIGEEDSWHSSYKHSVTITKGIMEFIARKYNKKYAPNTRETFRRQVLHQFVQAGIVDYNPDNLNLPTNSPNAHYSLTEEVLIAIKAFNTKAWKSTVNAFKKKQKTLSEIYQKKRNTKKIPVRLPNGLTFELSPGKHNEVQSAIIKEFAPRFAPGALVLYLGDTASKILFIDETELSNIDISITNHDKLPDVILLDKNRNWLYLIEAVTSHGPMNPKRIVELETMMRNCKCGKVYVSAFPDFKEFKRHINQIAWETEVWICEFPEHMIHYNGEHFFGPR